MARESRRVKIALAGIPNVGKSLIFNRLTGGRAWVGNWPGVTVEKKVGTLRVNGAEIKVVDLPGIYSLTAYSVDELIARNFIVEEKPDVVVCIVSAINLERSLYLALSLLELGVNVIIDLNMVDLAEKEGCRIDYKKLESLIGVPVVPTVATTGQGISRLKEAIVKAIHEKKVQVRIVDYGKIVEEAISKIEEAIKDLAPKLAEKYPARWIALKLLEGDSDIVGKVSKLPAGKEIIDKANQLREVLGKKVGDLESYIVKQRYERVLEIVKAVVEKVAVLRVSMTDLLDSVLTHKIVGIPFALSAIYLLFRFAFEVSAPLADLVDVAINSYLHDLVLGIHGLPDWLSSFLADGVIAGVGAVLVFLPVIAFFFLGFAILEDV
ncbi:MAG: ferrous iron transporter B, partial [Thermoprotei archaeon]